MDENEGPTTGLADWIKGHSTMLLVVVVGLVIAVVFIKKPAGSGSSQPASQDLSGLQTDPTTGAKIIYRDTADTFINSTTTIDSNNQTVNPNPTQPVASAPSTNTNTQEHPIEATIRATGAVADYDKKHPEGVPIRSTPGGAVIGALPFGSQVQITGAPVTGVSNFGGNAGSMVWLPVAGGYVSAWDLTGGYPS